MFETGSHRSILPAVILLAAIGLCLTLTACSSVTPPADVSLVIVGKYSFSVTGISAWRDWQPIVSSPGPDGGSPLRARVRVMVENSETMPVRLSFKGYVIDMQGRRYPLAFRIMPDYRMIPETVVPAISALDEKGRKSLLDKYNVLWDGSLKAGEHREIELFTNDGPYLPVGSPVSIAITWRDSRGNSTDLHSEDTEIKKRKDSEEKER